MKWAPEGKKQRKREEEGMQGALVDLLRNNAKHNVIWYAVMNGGKRTPGAARTAKKMGLVAGVYDFAGALPPKGTAWFLELKTASGVVSAEQIAFGELCERNGSLHHIAYSLESAVNFLVAIDAMKPVKF